MIERYRLTLNYSGLSDYEKEKIISVFTAKSAKDALNKTNKLLDQYKRKELRVSFKIKNFLEALAISADADIHVEKR